MAGKKQKKRDTGGGKAARIRDLKSRLMKLRKRMKAAKASAVPATAPASGAPVISPLAPAGGFPDMPVIDGVAFAATAAGVRYADRDDVMLACIAPGAALAGVFTRSATRSAPVLDCEAKLASHAAGETQGAAGFAILVNSGNANAFTGSAGVDAVRATTSGVAEVLKIPEAHVFSSSTGVIGEPLVHERITAVLERLAARLAPDRAGDAARAIMTTDTFPKGAAVCADIDGVTVRIAGFAKGSGMIAPDMATMLVYIFTDAAVAQPVLQSMLSALNRDTFNAITVDSDTSTSDTVLVAATGRAGNAPITSARSKAGRAFAVALGGVMRDLAHQVVRDGEGATKFVEVAVSGATSAVAARKVAMAVANSPLVKTAVAGEDPNWGRVVMAVGKSGAEADRDRLSIRFGDILVAKNGQVAASYREAEGAAYMKNAELVIGVDLGLGKGRATVWTCDLTHRYIAINADYRS